MIPAVEISPASRLACKDTCAAMYRLRNEYFEKWPRLSKKHDLLKRTGTVISALWVQRVTPLGGPRLSTQLSGPHDIKKPAAQRETVGQE
jgi:hypothetical protein